MNNLVFLPEAWDDYLYWQTEDRKTLKRINALLKDINRDSYNGIGKPEPLKGNYSGWWSRRIDDVNRIVYCQKGDEIIIASCKDHYTDQKRKAAGFNPSLVFLVGQKFYILNGSYNRVKY